MTTTVREAEKKGFNFKGTQKENRRGLKIEIRKAKNEIQRLRIIRRDCKTKKQNCTEIRALIKSEIGRLVLLQQKLSNTLR